MLRERGSGTVKRWRSVTAWLAGLSSRRSQHLVFVAHVWLFTPFLVMWLRDKRIQEILGAKAVAQLQPLVLGVVLYLAIRTWIAYKDPPWLQWDLVFPPIDVVLITAILCVSHRGPMSNIALLYFLPLVEAAGTLNVAWSAAVAIMVVLGTGLSTFFGLGAQPLLSAGTLKELWDDQALNVVFRLYFLLVLSSLMTYQALIAAGMRQKLAVAADRNRIAADMHDGVQGHLITIASQLELLSRLAEKDPVRAAELARDARDMARMGADELRFLVQRMRAPALTEGFIPALQQYAHNLCSRHNLRLEFSVEGANGTLEPEEEAALFRVSQEALNNVVKHAQASMVCVVVRFGAKVELEIRDDGIGFDAGAVGASDGLAGMCDRLKQLGGELTVTSKPQQGTIVEARV
ncbi:MAG: sensor histidine kinase [Fimbriimonas sp.]